MVEMVLLSTHRCEIKEELLVGPRVQMVKEIGKKALDR